MIYLRSTILGAALVLLLSGCRVSDPEPEATSARPGVIATGQFISKGGQETSGMYQLAHVGEYRRLLLTDDFHTDEGPDLHVVLSPTAAEETANENAMVKGSAVLDTLSAIQGKQVFYLADTLDIDRFRSVLIHCVEHTHLYGAAPIEPPQE